MSISVNISHLITAQNCPNQFFVNLCYICYPLNLGCFRCWMRYPFLSPSKSPFVFMSPLTLVIQILDSSDFDLSLRYLTAFKLHKPFSWFSKEVILIQYCYSKYLLCLNSNGKPTTRDRINIIPKRMYRLFIKGVSAPMNGQ